MVSSWGALGCFSPLQIDLPTEKTKPSQDSAGSCYLQNSHLQQLQEAGHLANGALNQKFRSSVGFGLFT